jgi:hypothetical protein
MKAQCLVVHPALHKGPLESQMVMLAEFCKDFVEVGLEGFGVAGLEGQPLVLDLSPDNLDMSDALAISVENRNLAYFNAKFFLGFINDFEVVNTNRLHVAIGVALLGKHVKFYPNSYFKYRAVYEYSMQKFNNVEFMGAA